MTSYCEMTAVSGLLTVALAQMFASYVQYDTQPNLCSKCMVLTFFFSERL